MIKETIREQLRTTHTDADLQTWFDPLRLLISDSGNVEVRFPHVLFARWFSKERKKNLERELTRFLGTQPKILYVKPESDRTDASKNSGKFLRNGSSLSTSRSAEYAQWSFDTFIFNKKNEFPVSMAREIASSMDNPAYIPFLICGKGTCGKTHLLRAMAGAMTRSASKVHLSTVEELQTMFSENEKPGVFKRKLQRYKAILIDNAQDFIKYPDLQQELIHIVDVFREKKKPFVLALDEWLDQTAINPKFRSRLESGLIVTVKKPDLDIRLRYVKAQCAANRLHLKKDFLLTLAQRFQSLPAIQGFVVKIAAYQQKTGKEITSSDLDKLMANVAITGNPATAESIIAHVAENFSLAAEEITGDSRSSSIVFARQVAMYLCRELLGISFSALGRYFNGKNHATVLYAYNKIKKSIETDKKIHTKITVIRKKFLSQVS